MVIEGLGGVRGGGGGLDKRWIMVRVIFGVRAQGGIPGAGSKGTPEAGHLTRQFCKARAMPCVGRTLERVHLPAEPRLDGRVHSLGDVYKQIRVSSEMDIMDFFFDDMGDVGLRAAGNLGMIYTRNAR